MKIFGFDIRRQAKAAEGDVDTILRRLHAFYDTVSGVAVTPESCMQAPTVQAIVQGVSRRLSVMPIQVLKKGMSKGRETKEPLPNHSVAKLLNRPNNWQTRMNFWLDTTSVLLRYANHYNYKKQGMTGPIRALIPLYPYCVDPLQDDETYEVSYRVTQGTRQKIVPQWEMNHIRGAARNFLKGDSPVWDVREAIALEIAAEKFGASFFGNGALPFIVFKFMEAKKQGFKDEADETAFINNFQESFTKGRQFRAFALPPGMEMADPITISNDKAQFLETRKYQRTVIAGAWGVPPHIAGDLERATFNNIEQQSLDVQISVILPYAMMIECAMERDLLTDADRANGVIIRFNMDALLRGDFKSRQEGLAIQRQWAIISTNEWRERENMNPSDQEGADDLIGPANFVPLGTPPPTAGAPGSGTPPVKDPVAQPPEKEEPNDNPKGIDWEDNRRQVYMNGTGALAKMFQDMTEAEREAKSAIRKAQKLVIGGRH